MSWTRNATISILLSFFILSSREVLLGGTGRWTTGGPPGADVCTLVVSPSRPSVLYAGLRNGAVFRSADSGNSWTATHLSVSTSGAELLAIDPTDSNRVYSLVTTIPAPPSVTPRTVLFRSDDGGATATGLSDLPEPMLPDSLAIDPSSPSNLYVSNTLAQFAGSGVFKSEDGGLTWHPPASGLGDSDVYALAIDPADSSILYAVVPEGLFRSADHGSNWQIVPLPPGGASTSSILIGRGSPAIVYVQTSAGIFRGIDPVEEWSSAGAGLSPGSNLLAVDPANGSTIYAASPDAQISRSTDSGEHWLPFPSDGLTGGAPLALAISPDGRALHLATSAGVFDFDTLGEGPCAAGPETLCLNGGRFEVRSQWSAVHNHQSGVGESHPLTSDTGAFWFFTPNNLELMVKVVDGRAYNDKFWVFAGGMSNVEYSITVRDTETGEIRFYRNSQDQLTSFADTAAFAGGAAASALVAEPISSPLAASTCDGDFTTLCLNGGRFRARVAWSTSNPERGGDGGAVPVTADTGTFWFFTPNNLEVILKVVDGRAYNGKFWVFLGSLSNVAYTVTITDTETGLTRTYSNSEGSLASQADTEAF